jgi:hypothetical protein
MRRLGGPGRPRYRGGERDRQALRFELAGKECDPGRVGVGERRSSRRRRTTHECRVRLDPEPEKWTPALRSKGI